MPDLPFVAKGITDVLTGQEKMRIGAQALKDLYKQQNLEMAGAASAARSAVAGTLTEMEKIEKKIAAVKLGLSKGVIDPAKGEEALKRLQGKLDLMKKSATESQRALAGAFGDEILSRITRFAGPAGIIAGAMTAITSEMRAQMALVDKTADLKMGLSASRNVVLRNMPGVDDATRQAVLRENRRLADKLGIDENAINLARAEALSSSGGNRASSLAAVTGAAKFLFDQPQEIGGFAGSLLDLSKVTGTDNADVNLGLLTQVAGLSRVSDAKKQAANIPRALIGMRGMGFSTAEAAAAYAALTEFSADITGESSGSAGVNFAKQLREFTPDALFGMTPGQKLSAIQQDSKLRADFLSNFTAEALKLAPLEQMLDANSPVARRFAENIGKLGDNESLRRQGQETLSGLEVNELNRLARYEARLRAINQSFAADDPVPNLTAPGRQEVQDLLTRAGQSNLGGQARMALSRLNDSSIGLSIDEANSLYKPIIDDLRDGTTELREMQTSVFGIPFGKSTIPVQREATPEELKVANKLEELIQATKDQTEEVKKNKPAPNSIPTR